MLSLCLKRPPSRSGFFCILVFTVYACLCEVTIATDSNVREQPLPIDEAMQAFVLADGFRMEVVCHEPQVVDPVSARFDHLGRLWVVEMNDYPTGPTDGVSFSGRIKVLRDLDDDGFFETATVFADQLVFPTGVQPFNGGIFGDETVSDDAGGVIVTLAGQVCYMADYDGDGVCDVRQEWFSGFSTGNEQLRANHPTWTLENQVHVASGLRGGEVIAVDKRWQQRPEKLSLVTRDFQFSPFGGSWHSVAGNSQYGFYQDAATRQYICSNRNPCDLLLAEPSQVSNNPLFALARWTVNVMPAAEQSRVFPLVNAWTTSNLHAGQFTAACGVFRYESDALNNLRDDFFACEPTGSLVQRYRTAADGIVPQTKPAYDQAEFLASHDPWFRPVDLTDGPDGAIYVIDMHRAVIEHPAWMPDELKGRRDLRWGDSAGRIYRIVADKAAGNTDSKIDFAVSDRRQKVAALASNNRWTRTTAARLIAEELARSKRPAATGIGRDGEANFYSLLLNAYLSDYLRGEEKKPDDWRGVVAALWLLEFSALLTPEHLSQAAAAKDQEVRTQVVRLVAKQMREQDLLEKKQYMKLVEKLATDSRPRVRFQWLLEFGPEEIGAEPAEARAESTLKLLLASAQDGEQDRKWIANGLSLVSSDLAENFISKVDAELLDDANLLGPLIERMGWNGSVRTLDLLLEIASSQARQSECMPVFARGMLARGKTWDQLERQLSANGIERLRSWIAWNREVAADPKVPTEQRVAAAERLRLDRSNDSLELCKQLLDSNEPAVFVAALGAVRDADAPELPMQLVKTLANLPPEASTAMVGIFASNANWTPAIIDAIERGEVPLGMINATSRGRILRSPNAEIAERFKILIAAGGGEKMDEILVRYRSALAKDPDIEIGRRVFAKNCSACHRIGDEGFAVGPDISDMRTQTAEQILIAIIDPNAAIDANYYRYSVLTTDGQVLEGLLVDSGSESVSLRQQEGTVRTILRDSIELFRTTGASMMPEGLHEQIAPDEMRDLIGYLKGWRFDAAGIPGL